MSAPEASDHKFLNAEQKPSIKDARMLNRINYLCPQSIDLERSMSAMQNTILGGTYFGIKDAEWRRRAQT